MAIINTFERCLGSPYLVEDAAAADRVPALLRLAADRIEAAAGVLGARPGSADAVLFSYEAIFACLRALVYSRGYREAGLRCLLIAFGRLYVEPGLFDAASIHEFERAQALQMGGEEALKSATAWIARTIELIGGDGTDDIRPGAVSSSDPA